MEYSNENRGALWPNDRMREGKQDPHFTGSLNVDGREFWVSAWKRKPDAKEGAPSLSFTVNAKDANKAPNPSRNAPPADEFGDDIPW